jgi:purine-binding chemotaxis protein CheW
MNGHELSALSTNQDTRWVVFLLDEQRYALHLSCVERAVRAAEVTPLPKAPEIVLGVINVQGQIVPVVDIRKRFRLPQREIDPSHRFILARSSRRRIAIVADSIQGLAQRPQGDVIAPEKILPGMEYVDGVAKLEDGMALIHDLDKFLSFDEERGLSETLTKTSLG